jgi:hypothetical protein
LACPGCGLTRACVLLLSGHFREAIAMHAFAPLAVAGLAILSVGMVLPRTPRAAFVGFLSRFDHSQRLAGAALAALLAYWLGRLVLDGRI